MPVAKKATGRSEVDDATWDKTVEEIMARYADVWERMSGYTQEERATDARKREYEREILKAKKAKKGRV